MTKEEFKQKIENSIKKIMAHHMLELEKITKETPNNLYELHQRHREIEKLSFKTISKITEENNAKITFVSPKIIRGVAKFDDFESIEFEIKFNEEEVNSKNKS
jgi:hypothetical protein